MSEIVQVQLGGETFKLRVDRDPSALAAAAALVDDRIAELRGGGVSSPRMAALLAALALADDLLAVRASRDALRDRVGSSLDAIAGRLDSLDATIDALDAAPPDPTPLDDLPEAGPAPAEPSTPASGPPALEDAGA
jgi:cell division protein ZapA (FtsZ GTPase activity inhibitor)